MTWTKDTEEKYNKELYQSQQFKIKVHETHFNFIRKAYWLIPQISSSKHPRIDQ